VNTVRVLENGPLALRGTLMINGAPAGYRATLCRCGRSQHKPFCDGTHAQVGFSASGEPAGRESAALAVRGGPLELALQKNGPLRIVGPVEIIAGTGHTLNRGQEFFLCRCGQSRTKPYCDGSHKAAGFADD
jgi:CDGSH-type Zn-finger protein